MTGSLGSTRLGQRRVNASHAAAAMQFRHPKPPEPRPAEGVISVAGIMFAAI